MPKLISQTKVKKSTKVFHCDGCNEILEFGSFSDFVTHFKLTEDEIHTLAAAEANGYKILPGQPYIKQFIADEGDKWVYRCIPEVFAILNKYDILN